MTHINLSFFLLTFMLAALCGCTGSEEADVTSARESISIGVPKEPLGALVIIASDRGFFDDVGLDVNVVDTYPSGKRALQGMLEKEVDLTISSEVPLVFKGFERDDFRILATIGESADEPSIIAREDKGISEPGDLRGKNIATQLGSAVHYFLHLFLLKHGIQEVDVTFLPAEELPQALADGRIDAFSMREPFIGRARALLPDGAVVFREPGMYLKTMNLVALSQLVNERSDAIEKALRALVRAEAFVGSNRDQAMGIVANELNIDAAQLTKVFEGVKLELTLSHALVIAMEDEASWAINSGLTNETAVPDFLQLISPDAIKKVNPTVVTIIE